MKTRRIFTCIDLPDEAKEAIKAIHNTKIYPIKWMAAGNLHITLNFLGELGDERIEEVKDILAMVSSRFNPFDLTLNRLTPKRHMLWLVPDEKNDLLELKYDLGHELKKKRLGKRDRERYSPHVLVARQKNERRKMKFEAKNFKPVQLRVESVNLYESRLAPGTATHILLQSFKLGYEN